MANSYADKVALIMRVKEFILSGDVHLTGTLGLMLALFADRKTPSPDILAVMFMVLRPSDVDFVFASEDSTVFEAFMKALTHGSTSEERSDKGCFTYAWRKPRGAGWEFNPFDDALPENEKAILASSPLQGSSAIKSQIMTVRVTDKFILINDFFVNGVGVDIRVSRGPKQTVRDMYKVSKLDVTTLKKGADVLEVKATWELKKCFSLYYTRINSLDQSLARGLEALAATAAGEPEEDLAAYMKFIRSEADKLSVIAKGFRTPGTAGYRMAASLRSM